MVYARGLFAYLESYLLSRLSGDDHGRPNVLRLAFFYVAARLATKADLDRQMRRRQFPTFEWETVIQVELEDAYEGGDTLWYFQGIFVNPEQALEHIGGLASTGRLVQEAAECFTQLIIGGFEGYAYCDADGKLRNSRVVPLDD